MISTSVKNKTNPNLEISFEESQLSVIDEKNKSLLEYNNIKSIDVIDNDQNQLTKLVLFVICLISFDFNGFNPFHKDKQFKVITNSNIEKIFSLRYYDEQLVKKLDVLITTSSYNWT